MRRRITTAEKVPSRIPARIRAGAVLCMLSLALWSCDSFDFYGLLDGVRAGGQQGGALGISPLSVTVAINATCAFTASGGVRPYTFVVTSGAGTVDRDTGVYRAPAEPSFDVVQVTDSAGEAAETHVVVTQ
jgi:hypothetical protein